eukprot:gene188-347_t
MTGVVFALRDGTRHDFRNGVFVPHQQHPPPHPVNANGHVSLMLHQQVQAMNAEFRNALRVLIRASISGEDHLEFFAPHGAMHKSYCGDKMRKRIVKLGINFLHELGDLISNIESTFGNLVDMHAELQNEGILLLDETVLFLGLADDARSRIEIARELYRRLTVALLPYRPLIQR